MHTICTRPYSFGLAALLLAAACGPASAGAPVVAASALAPLWRHSFAEGQCTAAAQHCGLWLYFGSIVTLTIITTDGEIFSKTYDPPVVPAGDNSGITDVDLSVPQSVLRKARAISVWGSHRGVTHHD